MTVFVTDVHKQEEFGILVVGSPFDKMLSHSIFLVQPEGLHVKDDEGGLL